MCRTDRGAPGGNGRCTIELNILIRDTGGIGIAGQKTLNELFTHEMRHLVSAEDQILPHCRIWWSGHSIRN